MPSISINTNLSSLIAQQSLKQSSNKLNLAVERMSTGFKINHAKDNAANYSISTNMTTKIGAYQVAEDNVAMGLDLLSTANGSLNQISDKLSRLRALAEQSANGTYGGGKSKLAINAEANSLVDEIERLYNTTEYNGKKLFTDYKLQTTDGNNGDYELSAQYNGFINNPIDYSEDEIADMEKLAEISTFTSSTTYSISTPEELAKLATMVNNGNDASGCTFVLAADIDLSDYTSGEGWIPIGNKDNPFRGYFNGNGHKITNLYIKKSLYVGLFGYTTKGLSNLAIEDANATGAASVGIIIGAGYGGVVDNCYATGTVQSTNGSNSGANIGGIVGDSGSVKNSYFIGDISAKRNVGGIAGGCYGSIENCYAKGSINSNGENVGGIVGLLLRDSVVNDCTSLVDVSAIKNYSNLIGAIRITNDGVTFNSLSVDNCYAYSNENNMIGATIGDAANYDPIYYDMTDWINGIMGLDFLPKINILQVGVNEKDSSQISYVLGFKLESLSSLRNIGTGNDDYLSKVDTLIDSISAKAVEFGSAQNRLESALDEISTQYENLVSSRSTLRDADISKVSSEYIRQQILQEASATLLATANQSPSIALQLI